MIKKLFESLDSFTTEEIMAEIERRKSSLPNAHQAAIKFMKEMDEGISNYGEYSFFDKGPDSVMFIDTSRFNKVDAEEAAEILTDILDKYKYYSKLTNLNHKYASETLVSYIITEIQSIQWFDELFDMDRRFATLY